MNDDAADEAAKLRVLVVDDQVDNANMMSCLLDLNGCRTAVAFEGRAAVDVALEFRPQLVFLDYDMPGANGLQVLRLLRAAMATPFLAVCVTGNNEDDIEQRCLAGGFDHFIAKPTPLELLKEFLLEAKSSGSEI